MSAPASRLPLDLPRPVRAERGRVVAGVCSGLADALDVDVTFVRLAFTMLAFASGAGIVAYLGAWALLPAPEAPRPRRMRRVVGAILLVWAAIFWSPSIAASLTLSSSSSASFSSAARSFSAAAARAA